MSRVTYTASEYVDMVLLYGECHGNAALALRKYKERYGASRVCPSNPRIIVLAVLRLRENKTIVPRSEGGVNRQIHVSKEEKILEHFSRNPSSTYSSAARQFKVCESTVNKIVKQHKADRELEE